MDYNDYVVLIDENGQPYIAHSRLGDAAKNTAHKYLDKALVGGKWVYAYTQQELEALRRGGGRVKAKVKDKLGYDERDRRDAAKNNLRDAEINNAQHRNKPSKDSIAAQNAFNRAQEEYSKTALGKLENLKNSLKVRGRLAANTIKRYGSMTLAEIRRGAENAGNTIGSAINTAARYVPGTKQNKSYKAVNAAQERGERDTERARRQQEAQRQQEEAQRQKIKARSDYRTRQTS